MIIIMSITSVHETCSNDAPIIIFFFKLLYVSFAERHRAAYYVHVAVTRVPIGTNNIVEAPLKQ